MKVEKVIDLKNAKSLKTNSNKNDKPSYTSSVNQELPNAGASNVDNTQIYLCLGMAVMALMTLIVCHSLHLKKVKKS